MLKRASNQVFIVSLCYHIYTKDDGGNITITKRECRQKLGLNRNGWSQDNSMCEGFFGTIKNEFFYPNGWKYKLS